MKRRNRILWLAALYSPYILINDVPKVRALKKRFPTLYRDDR